MPVGTGEGAAIIIIIPRSKDLQQIFDELGVPQSFARSFNGNLSFYKQAINYEKIDKDKWKIYIAHFMFAVHYDGDEDVYYPEERDLYEEISDYLKKVKMDEIKVLYDSEEEYT